MMHALRTECQEETVVKTIFTDLNRERVPFVLLRSVGDLEIVLRSGRGDIDLFVAEKDWPMVITVLNRHGFHRLFGMKSFLSKEHGFFFDIHHGQYERLPILRENELIADRSSSSGWPLLPDHLLLAVLLLHPLDLTGFRGQRSYSETRYNTIFEHWSNETTRERFLDWASSRLGRRYTELLRRLVEQQFDRLPNLVWLLRIALYISRPAYLKYPLARLCKKIFLPESFKGRVVAVSGVDGSGKTTLINNMIHFLERYYGSQNAVRYVYMGRQGGFRLPLVRLSNLGRRIVGRSNLERHGPGVNEGERVSSSYDMVATHTFDRKIWKVVLPIEFGVRLAELIFFLRIQHKVVIADRYITDFAQDNNMKSFLDFMLWIFPKPSHMFFIEGDTNLFFRRKGEYLPNELAQMQEQIRQQILIAYGERVIVLDGNKSEEEVFEEALEKLSEPINRVDRVVRK